MAGSSLVAPTASGWVGQFLLAAFYRRPRADRSVDDLRLAHGVLASFWAHEGRRINARDRRAFADAFGKQALRGSRGSLGTLALEAGAATLFGDWFIAAWDDPDRRTYGIAFQTPTARAAFDPATRLRHARLGALAPPQCSPDRQIWATYPAVELTNPDAALELLLEPWRWPDFASAGGRFTPVRRGGLLGQTFEIHLPAHPTPHVLVATRGYVTCTAVRTAGADLDDAVAAIPLRLAVLPPTGTPLAMVELTTHRGHFMGHGISRLLVYDADGRTFIRDVGSWDPLPPVLAVAYRIGGHSAQLAFWGTSDPELGLLAQLELVTAR